ncbi:Serine/threonine-protein phosphatase 2A 56 kDa regulatory subunit gamma isoform [Hypsibius exemplaris]|uniref:Serine/threonine-protein phosphatase 2A 56 kDa regulatory subunit gamma isoform n=1 Tax=Hypsibius exemplaris TaxID=2072580 RepID=A0A1W0WFL9_HYPEX|nr:Serine/threonine-protein phosphatase 2A 56 kDa regulatory subunit gamma isoform [Hypsibius exemplaris]
MPKSVRKDSGINPVLDPIRAPAPRDAPVPLAPSASANPRPTANPRSTTNPATGPVIAGLTRVALPNIDAIIEQPPRRRSSIMASGFTGQDVPRIGKVSEAKDPQECEARFIAKCRACCTIYDLADTTRDQPGKEMKRATLQELCDLLRSTRGILSEPLYPELIHLVAVNAFRSLPPLNPNIIPEFDPVAEAEEPAMEVAWPHLQLVYNVFLSMLESPDFNAQLAVQYIDHTFVLQLLQLFDSEDPRERDLLKAIIHRMYGKLLMLRTYIRKQFNNIFYRVIYEVGRHQGLAEILEILGSIINGFVVPLREEHRLCLLKVLLPLHKVAGLVQFHPQLAYCMVQYLEKDPNLSADLLHHFLRLWPKTDGAKEVMFLNELEELLDVLEPEQFAKIMVPVFSQLALSASSPHFQIGERALFFFGNDYIRGLMKNHSAVLFPILYPVLYKISTGHWNKSTQSLAYHTLRMMMEIDQRTFDRCINIHSAKSVEEKDAAERRRHFELMQKVYRIAQRSPMYPQLAKSLNIRPPSMEDYVDRRNVSMKYENWKVTEDELKTRESQTAIDRPNCERNDLLGGRRRSMSAPVTQSAAPPTQMASVTNPLTGSPKPSLPLQSILNGTVSGLKSSNTAVPAVTVAPSNPEKKKSEDSQSLAQSSLKSAFSSLTRKTSGSADKSKK